MAKEVDRAASRCVQAVGWITADIVAADTQLEKKRGETS